MCTSAMIIMLALLVFVPVDGVVFTYSSGSLTILQRRCSLQRACDAQAQVVAEEGEGDEKMPVWQTPPPAGIPKQALADRNGPFWTTLGEPDEQTGARPNFLRRDDWHFSSVFSEEEREAQVLADSEDGSTAADGAEEGDVEITFPEPDEATYMAFESEDIDPIRERPEPLVPMPSSWQEYQHLVSQVQAIQSDGKMVVAMRDEAASHLEKLESFYETFKKILAEGYALLHAPLPTPTPYCTTHQTDPPTHSTAAALPLPSSPLHATPARWQLQYDPVINSASTFVVQMKKAQTAGI